MRIRNIFTFCFCFSVTAVLPVPCVLIASSRWRTASTTSGVELSLATPIHHIPLLCRILQTESESGVCTLLYYTRKYQLHQVRPLRMMYGFDMVLPKPPLLNLFNSAVPTYVSYHTVAVFPAKHPAAHGGWRPDPSARCAR